MPNAGLFFTAAGVGLAVAAPVGPMGMLCIRRTLTEGPRAGLAIGVGIASGDAIYGLVAALGMVSVSHFMLAYDKPLHLVAGLFLLYLCLRTLLQKPATDAAAIDCASAGTARAFASWLLLTLTNPQTIIMFAALFATLAPRGPFSSGVALTTVFGVFFGSIAWWCFLVAVVSGARHALGARVRRMIDRAAGLALAAFGVAEIRRSV
ncbi:Threonine/homoserine/homoserine lactone efflux protein [Caballeronia arationis]|jgi:threonine/homoserine/homoserine lactone efflux protein|uniref:Threonine/homoserine/homoserine lactone efflux protein n=1 Tax=Caballeronia arationis TaxID=1777142 RepID=A0A7Z7IEV8_9BURK|nr:LysE family transporter [Caballeronia arationis]SOE88581.1 Threonine/homoserine/homoserine lactone efflux protein [Caballeronia arationis]